MIDINQHFETETLSDVAYNALLTFSEADLDLCYLSSVHGELSDLKHWLIQLHYCYNKMSSENFNILCNKLNYEPSALKQAFKTICRQ